MDDEVPDETNNERRWRLSYLKDQFESLQLNNLYKRYNERISHGYFSQFLSLQIILVTTHFIILIALSDPSTVLQDLILYGLISILSIIILIITDTYVKQHPELLKYLSAVAYFIIFFANAFIPFYHINDSFDNKIRPAYTTYLIISNYIFFNIQQTLVAFALGLFISVFHIATLILVTYQDMDILEHKLYQRIASDTVYLICVNGMGIYFRYMNEIMIRRSFLDRRSCVESTLQLRYEEEQENHLMSSIIPQHFIQYFKEKFDNNQRRYSPFKDVYVKMHSNVSILFADIVNYTAMTTKLNINDLLDTLNELFGRFDDASEDLKVLRIKFLGDCYYCVSGLPPDPAPNHAEACVDLGLQMISIIADIRNRRNLNIDMRIGVHSGSINSGIIGSIKWQYDIWSVDVDLANKMETEGEAGKVHLTRQTKELLQKSYNISDHFKIVNNERTFLISPNPVDGTKNKSVTSNTDSTTASESLNDNNVRRPTIYMKRNTTLPILTSGVQIQQQRSLNGETATYNEDNEFIITQRRETLSNKRHTISNGTEKKISGMSTLNNFNRRISMNKRISGERRLTGDGKRRTAFMNNNINKYKETLEKTNKELKETIENMLLSKFEQWFKVNEMNRVFLIFKNFKTESNFFTIPDHLFKYYIVSVISLHILIYVLENLTLTSWELPSWEFYLSVGITLFLFLPMTWTHYFWITYASKLDDVEGEIPRNKIILFFYNCSKFVTKKVLIRIIIYTVVYLIFCISVLSEWVDCFNISILRNQDQVVHYKLYSLLLLLVRSNTTQDSNTENCIIPWQMTETCAIAIIMTFLFLRMYMWLKLFYASIITVIYSIAVYYFSGDFYQSPSSNQTFNKTLIPQVSHIISVVFLTVTLHLVDRQTEYMNRLDHLWYETLIDKQKQAKAKNALNNKLLKNILPIHVAELYLNVNRHSSDELYHEHYDGVAVIFASITNFRVEDMGVKFLNSMNVIISEFDKLTITNNFGRPIEKIKIAKWTYMAACGLVPGLGDVENLKRDHSNHPVICLLKFASELLKALKSCNSQTGQNMKLRIGISYGAIAAGVVGSKKPLYDIWGDPVNMASRMDTNGIPNKIQVLQETAEIIKEYGYVCEYRGDISIRGRDYPVTTYFVGLNDDFDLLQTTNIRQHHLINEERQLD